MQRKEYRRKEERISRVRRHLCICVYISTNILLYSYIYMLILYNSYLYLPLSETQGASSVTGEVQPSRAL